MFDFQHILTPIAIVARVRYGDRGRKIEYSTLHIFGFRVAYWAC